MAKRIIVTEPDELLRKVSRDVTVFDSRLHTLLDDMKQTLKDADGAGLAAVQVAVLKRVLIINTEGLFLEMVNPVIVSCSGEQSGHEGCLSVPGRSGIVKRSNEVCVDYFDRYGNKKQSTLTGFEARAVSHEIDHLNGILFTDHCEAFDDE